MRKLAFTLLLAGAVAFMPVAAQAGTVDISTFTGVSSTVTSNYYNGTTTVGSVIASDFQGLPPVPDGSAFVSFCVDLQNTISPPLNNQNASLDYMSNWNGYGAFVPQANAGRYAAYLYNTYGSNLAMNSERAGLALAIWDVLYDNDFDVTAGAFRATSTVAALTAAAGYLAGLQANLGLAAQADALWLRLYPVGGSLDWPPQDFITGVPDGGMTLMLLGGALMGLGAMRRKFRQ